MNHHVARLGEQLEQYCVVLLGEPFELLCGTARWAV